MQPVAQNEVVSLLQELLRLDTSNPPGNETPAAETVRAYLEQEGISCELYAREAHRSNVVARLPGRDAAAPRLLLLCHLDTVGVTAEEWSVGPWSGELIDDHVWGRGALDMKGQAAAAAATLATLARSGFEPSGDLILAACADEEVGAGFGLSWLCDEHPESVRSSYCVNEGAGDRIQVGGRVVYLCSLAEKVTAPLVIRIEGRGGHASMPGLADNPLVHAAAVLQALAGVATPPTIQPETRRFLEVLLDEPEPTLASVKTLRARSPGAATLLEPMLSATVVPTQLVGSEARNVIPSSCEIICDCRLLPGQSPEEVERAIHDAVGDVGVQLRWDSVTGGTRSVVHTPLWDACAAFVAAEEPGALLAPVLQPGFTDSHYLRERFGTIAYGFFPMRTMDARVAASLIHSADERVHVEDLDLGIRFLTSVARELLA